MAAAIKYEQLVEQLVNWTVASHRIDNNNNADNAIISLSVWEYNTRHESAASQDMRFYLVCVAHATQSRKQAREISHSTSLAD